MPGNDFVIKQNVLGSAAGISLLAFALAWRFLPSFSGGAAPEKAIAEPPSSAPMSVTAPKEAAPVNPVVAQEQPAEPPAPAPPAKPAPPPPEGDRAAACKAADKAFAEGHSARAERNQRIRALHAGARCRPGKCAAARAGLAKVHDALVKQVDAALDRDDETDASRGDRTTRNLPPQGTDWKRCVRLKLLADRSAADARRRSAQPGHATEPKGANALAVYREC
jgi:hypothetical protein